MLTNALQSLTGDRTLQIRTLSALTPPSPHLTEVIDVLTKLNHPPPYPTHLIARAIAIAGVSV